MYLALGQWACPDHKQKVGESCIFPTMHSEYRDTRGTTHILLTTIFPDTVLEAHITHLLKFTVMPAEPWNCVSQSKLHLMTSWPIGIVVDIPDYSCLKRVRSRGEWPPPPPMYNLSHWSGGGECSQGEGGSGVTTCGRGGSWQFYWDAHRRQTWRLCFVPEAWQHWPYKPSRQEMAVSVAHWYSVTGGVGWFCPFFGISSKVMGLWFTQVQYGELQIFFNFGSKTSESYPFKGP